MLDFVRSLFRMGAHRSIIIGLAVLYDLARSAEAKPYPPSLELRAVLGLLHALSGGDRRCYDDFWKAAIETRPPAASDYIGGICRKNDLTSSWHDILRRFGLEASIEVMSDIHRASATGKPPIPQRADGQL